MLGLTLARVQAAHKAKAWAAAEVVEDPAMSRRGKQSPLQDIRLCSGIVH